MAIDSVISHPAGLNFIRVQESHMKVVGGDWAAGLLLAFLESWHITKVNAAVQAKSHNRSRSRPKNEAVHYKGLWQWHSLAEIERGILGLATKNTIQDAIKTLIALGFVATRIDDDPNCEGNKCRFFLLQVDAIQEAMDLLYPPKRGLVKIDTPPGGGEGGGVGQISPGGGSDLHQHRVFPSLPCSPAAEAVAPDTSVTPLAPLSAAAEAMQEAGIGEPTLSRLAALPDVTPDLVKTEARKAKDRGKGTGALIRNIEAAARAAVAKRNKPAPAPAVKPTPRPAKREEVADPVAELAKLPEAVISQARSLVAGEASRTNNTMLMMKMTQPKLGRMAAAVVLEAVARLSAAEGYPSASAG